MYDFGFGDGRSFDLIATDGGLLGAPVRVDEHPAVAGRARRDRGDAGTGRAGRPAVEGARSGTQRRLGDAST